MNKQIKRFLLKRCQECKKEFKTWPSVIKRKGGKYCSRVCRKRIKNCLSCRKIFRTFRCRIKTGRGKFCSKKCVFDFKRSSKYGAIHMWLRKKYGKADLCSNKTCKKNSKRFEWALIKGKKYEREGANFIKLCMPCHKYYDNIY